MKIPIFQGSYHLGFCCDEGTLRRYQSAVNAEIVRRRKDKAPVRINLFAVVQAPEKARSIGPSSLRLHYKEPMPTGRLITLKRYDPQTQQFVYWSSSDGFNPKRFNPDRVPSSPVAAFA